jgi:hypothetical protein
MMIKKLKVKILFLNFLLLISFFQIAFSDELTNSSKVNEPTPSEATPTVRDLPKPKIVTPENVIEKTQEEIELEEKQKRINGLIEDISGPSNSNGKKSGKKLETSDQTIFDQEESIKKMAQSLNKDIDPKTLKKMKIHEVVESTLKPLQILSEKELMNQLLDNTKGTEAYQYFVKFPKLTLLAVKLIKDPKAIPEASKILENRDKLVKFSAVMIFSLLIGIFVKKILSKKDAKILEALQYFFIRTLVMLFIRIAIVYLFFGKELGPFLNILSDNLF